jgi:hypothetical protein
LLRNKRNIERPHQQSKAISYEISQREKRNARSAKPQGQRKESATKRGNHAGNRQREKEAHGEGRLTTSNAEKPSSTGRLLWRRAALMRAAGGCALSAARYSGTSGIAGAPLPVMDQNSLMMPHQCDAMSGEAPACLHPPSFATAV